MELLTAKLPKRLSQPSNKKKNPMAESLKYNKLGKVRITAAFLKEEPGTVAEILAKMKAVPVRVEPCLAVPQYEFTLFSESFPENPIGEEIPTYTLQITTERKIEIVSVKVFDKNDNVVME